MRLLREARALRRLILVLVVVILGGAGFTLWRIGAASESARAGGPASIADLANLKGRWQRLDGGYVVEIRSIGVDGTMEAAYYNPRPIHVARAEASRDGATLKVLIELRDANYPGSTYTLAYDPASDQLRGVYYQAVERQRFPVALVRLR